MPRSVAGHAPLAVALLLSLGSLPSAGQAPPAADGAAEVDTRWLPWIGCWQLREEQVERTAGQGAGFPDRTFVCLEPTADGAGARLAASANAEILVERTLLADGARHAVTEGDCDGWEAREWSADGRRLFTRAELRCGTAPPRRVSGISLFSTRSTWVDMQLIDSNDRQHLEIRRYHPVTDTERRELVGGHGALPASPREIRDARQAAADSLGLATVREAAQKAEARVVEAMLAETEPRLAVDRATLIELDDAGIDGGVIDLLVALAYPEQFVVERRTGGGGGGGSWTSGAFGYGSPLSYDPIWYRDLYPYYITPLGYGGWSSGYSPYFYGGAAASPFITLQNDEEEPGGRAIVGRGYTRVRPRSLDAGGSGRTATRRRGGGSSSGSPPRAAAPRSGGASDGGGRVTPGGYSRGGGNRGGRTAVPRR